MDELATDLADIIRRLRILILQADQDNAPQVRRLAVSLLVAALEVRDQAIELRRWSATLN